MAPPMSRKVSARPTGHQPEIPVPQESAAAPLEEAAPEALSPHASALPPLDLGTRLLIESTGGVEALRRFLATLPVPQVLALFYGRRYAELELTLRPLLDEARRISGAGDKRRLLASIYGVGVKSPLLSNVAFQRLPSKSKREFLEGLRARVATKYPWLRYKTIHAFAFAPEYFDKRSAPLAGRAKAWGPLYRPLRVPKGRGKQRQLLIPNPPLKYLQKAVVSLLTEPARAAIPDWVFGVGPQRTAFDAAERHLGQRFFLSCDIGSFFDNVRMHHVVTGLGLLGGVSPDSREGVAHDTRILIARLCTHRGRLPQGAPSSPLLANLAFVDVDRRIRAKLSEVLRSGFVYTRYFDDITVSVSRATAAKLGVRSAREFRERIEPLIKGYVEDAGFSLNGDKTRASANDQGHRVTGLVVRDGTITLPRSARRHVGKLVEQVTKMGVLEAGTFRFGGDVAGETRVLSEENWFRQRRLSTERIVAPLIARMGQGLVIMVASQGKEPVPVPRKRRAKVLATVLSATLNGQARAVPVGEDEVRLALTDRDVLVKGSGAGLLVAPRQQVLAACELLVLVHGWWSYLHATPARPAFEAIRRLGAALGTAIEGMEVQVPVPAGPAAPVARASVALALDPAEDLVLAVHDTEKCLAKYAKCAAAAGLSDAPRALGGGRTGEQAELRLWTKVSALDCLPPDRKVAGAMAGPVRQLMLRAEDLAGLRTGAYKELQQFKERSERIGAARATRHLLADIQGVFESEIGAADVGSPDWKGRQWRVAAVIRDAGSALIAASTEFEAVHGQLRTTGKTKRLFTETTKESLEALRRFIEGPSRDGLDFVLEVAMVAWKATFDRGALETGRLRSAAGQEPAERVRAQLRGQAGPELTRAMRDLKVLRHFKAHPKKQDEAKKCYGLVENRLGLIRPPKDEPIVRPALTAHEGQLLAEGLLRELVNGLRPLTEWNVERFEQLRTSSKAKGSATFPSTGVRRKRR